MPDDLSFRAVSEAASANAEALCRRLLPAGQRKGDWWLCSVPWRPDKNPSFIVSLTTGKWKDCARQGEHGDFIDLVQRQRGLSNAEAMKEVARLLGMVP